MSPLTALQAPWGFKIYPSLLIWLIFTSLVMLVGPAIGSIIVALYPRSRVSGTVSPIRLTPRVKDKEAKTRKAA